MKVLVAGASGAIGHPLLEELIYIGHDTYGITHTEAKTQTLAAKGARPILLDVLDKEAVKKVMEEVRPDVVIDMLTALPQEYTPDAMQKAAERNVKVRKEGGGFLQEAAEACGVRRYIVQSCGFWYEPGEGLATEETSFAYEATPMISIGAHLFAEIERRVLQSQKIEGVALRFGFFYGPGTWFHPKGSMAERVRNREFPLIGAGEGVWSFVHVKDAAKAIAEAVYSSPGAFNVVNNRPVAMREWLPAFARYVEAPTPPRISEEEGLKTYGADTVYYAAKLRGAANAKAKHELNFQPRTFKWFLGR